MADKHKLFVAEGRGKMQNARQGGDRPPAVPPFDTQTQTKKARVILRAHCDTAGAHHVRI